MHRQARLCFDGNNAGKPHTTVHFFHLLGWLVVLFFTRFWLPQTVHAAVIKSSMNRQTTEVNLQNAPFCIAKLPLLERKTATFRTQNWQF